jgi:hypothetical protein
MREREGRIAQENEFPFQNYLTTFVHTECLSSYTVSDEDISVNSVRQFSLLYLSLRKEKEQNMVCIYVILIHNSGTKDFIQEIYSVVQKVYNYRK